MNARRTKTGRDCRPPFFFFLNDPAPPDTYPLPPPAPLPISAVARLGENKPYQLPPFAESDRRLKKVLQIKISDGPRNRKKKKTADLRELARRKASGDE